MNNTTIENVLRTILKDGIRTYKKSNSSASLPARHMAEKEEKQIREHNAVFMVADKQHFTSMGVKGLVVTSYEALADIQPNVSHWSPDPYMFGTYTSDKRTYIKGHEEKNLRQINTFTIDIDSKKHTYNEILLSCKDLGIGIPTLILETPKGFQVYFVLDKPLYITNKNDYRGLYVAKRIAENLKQSLRTELEVDMTCNDFGFFRMPSSENVRWFDSDYTLTLNSLIAWSQREDDNKGRTLYTVKSSFEKVDFTLQEWYRDLLSQYDIKGFKGQYGRNTTLFMMALCCYADGWEKERAFNHLDEANTRLHYSIQNNELERVLNSAYSGKYSGPKKIYIEAIQESWGSSHTPVQYGLNGYYKHAKQREDRERSHLHEWESDLVTYIQSKIVDGNTFIQCTQKEICEALGIANSTLNKLLKTTKKIIHKTVGIGRGAKTILSTVAILFEAAIKKNKKVKALLVELKTQKTEYLNHLNVLLEGWEPNLAYIELEACFAMLNGSLLDKERGSPKIRTG